MPETSRVGDASERPEVGSEKRSTMRSLDRALDVIDALVRADGPQRLVDIAQATGLSSATALRILTVLKDRKFVAVDGQRYQLGVANLASSYAFMRDSALSRHAKPYMQELAAATGLSVALYVRYGYSRVQIVRINGKDPLRYELPNGRLLPLHLGLGKVFSAYMEREEFDEFARDLPDVMRTIRGETFSIEDLWAETRQIRDQRFHVSHEERALGTVSLAAPVVDPRGDLFAVLALLGPTEHSGSIGDEALVAEITRAAGAIARVP